MKGNIHYGLNVYPMVEVTEDQMDRLVRAGGDGITWPYRFSSVTKRIWPEPRPEAEVFFREK